MQTLAVSASRRYEIHIGGKLLCQTGAFLRGLTDSSRVFVVSDDIVAEFYLERLFASLHDAGFCDTPSYVFPHGESSKTLATAERLFHFFSQQQATRSDLVIALGGGVVGDLTGFAASTYLRGIRYVQIPTTLLAQVDSSVGGKTAVDLPAGKNLVGTFWQPSLVLCDIDLLGTLNEATFADGAAEVLKYGAIRDSSLFHLASGPDYREHMEEIISRCIAIKRDIVQEDEFDTGERMLLNFGHTLGHAIETLSEYRISHGSAVAAGMVLITQAAERAGLTPSGTSGELIRACSLYQLPTTVDLEMEKLAGLCMQDKKRSGGTIRTILLQELGKAKIHSFSEEEFLSFLCGGTA